MYVFIFLIINYESNVKYPAPPLTVHTACSVEWFIKGSECVCLSFLLGFFLSSCLNDIVFMSIFLKGTIPFGTEAFTSIFALRDVLKSVDCTTISSAKIYVSTKCSV